MLHAHDAACSQTVQFEQMLAGCLDLFNARQVRSEQSVEIGDGAGQALGPVDLLVPFGDAVAQIGSNEAVAPVDDADVLEQFDRQPDRLPTPVGDQIRPALLDRY